MFTVYSNKNTAPTTPLVLTQNTYGDIVITSQDLYTWAAVHCAAPRAGLDAYFASGFPIVPKGVMSHGEHWYAGHVSDGFNLIGSDLFAFESATIYVWFDSGIPTFVPISGEGGAASTAGYFLVITYYPAGTTVFPVSTTTTDRVQLGRTIGDDKIITDGAGSTSLATYRTALISLGRICLLLNRPQFTCGLIRAFRRLYRLAAVSYTHLTLPTKRIV